MTKAELKTLAGSLNDGDIYLLNGRAVVYLSKVSLRPSGLHINYFPVRGGVVTSREKSVKVKEAHDLILLKSKQTMHVKYNESAVDKAKAQFKKAKSAGKEVVKKEKSSKPKSSAKASAKGDARFLILKKGKVIKCHLLKEGKAKSRIKVNSNGKSKEFIVPTTKLFKTRGTAKRHAEKR